jgi:hypothetical protein
MEACPRACRQPGRVTIGDSQTQEFAARLRPRSKVKKNRFETPSLTHIWNVPNLPFHETICEFCSQFTKHVIRRKIELLQVVTINEVIETREQKILRLVH